MRKLIDEVEAEGGLAAVINRADGCKASARDIAVPNIVENWKLFASCIANLAYGIYVYLSQPTNYTLSATPVDVGGGSFKRADCS